MQEADPRRDQTFVNTVGLRKAVDDPIIWRRLHDEHIGLMHLWFDRQSERYWAYALYPWLPDVDDLPYWAVDYDSRSTLMQSGASPQEAALKLFDDPRRVVPTGLSGAMMALSVEVIRLTRTVQHAT